ncbi:MAG: GNAT family N-acetyltransferase [Streptococcaceae bacterium]|jgi:GNAT superfamily N-acetyltransferase|nr:GNAT family N-acetyltransferase [Streptococcaceae bacterium]
MRLEKATFAQLTEILAIIASARAFLARQKLDQWQNAYPARADILADLETGVGYVLVGADRKIWGYCALLIGEDAHYTAITDGNWTNDSKNYVTIHRLALSENARGKGVGKLFFKAIFETMADENQHDFRIDTHADNAPMNALIVSTGFKKRGIVQFEGARIAYQKEI